MDYINQKDYVDIGLHNWVDTLNAIETSIVEILLEDGTRNWTERTLPTIGNQVHTNDGIYGEIKEISDNKFIVLSNDGMHRNTYMRDEIIAEYDDVLPMWGMMWRMPTLSEEEWILSHLQAVSDCGFRIFEIDGLGIFLGIDGGGYDFYSSHWLHLYRTMGYDKRDEAYKERVEKENEKREELQQQFDDLKELIISNSIKLSEEADRDTICGMLNIFLGGRDPYGIYNAVMDEINKNNGDIGYTVENQIYDQKIELKMQAEKAKGIERTYRIVPRQGNNGYTQLDD